MPQRVTLLAHTKVPHRCRSPTHERPPSTLLFLLIKVIEPVQQLTQSVTGKEGSLLQPMIKPLRPGHPAVLLLDRALTTPPRSPAAHRGKGWEQLTEQAVRALAARGRPLVSILRGRDARDLRPLPGSLPAVRSARPSPMPADRGFFGSRPFSRANDLLIQQGGQPVDWRLP
ncbi:hypothetical protein QFZ74_000524 [Streptomyces sp. V3I7]|nr:hypothetical protein [Streptomyces sp. V3I7]